MTALLMISASGAAGCAEFHGTDEGAAVTVGCSNNLTPDTSILEWELDVVPDREITGNQSFFADLGGLAVFGETFLDAAQRYIPGGVREVDLVELSATVRVRSGATGPDVTLKPADTDYVCARSRTACNPDHDLEGDPGFQPNTDCQPRSTSNPCARFVFLPISSDCDPDGVCDRLFKTGPGSQCDLNSFCITGPLRVKLASDTGRYSASSGGSVLFGWAEGPDTGATLRDTGPNEGTWILPQPLYEQPPGPVSLRLTIGGIPVAIECTMGVDSRGPDGVDSAAELSSPTPDSALVSFPIASPGD